MANVKEVEKWEPGIYQLETTDPVMGGEDGIDNLQAKQLANRTSYLKKQIENVSNLIPTVPVQSVNGKTGNIQLSAADVGTLTEQQLGERFLPAKLTKGDQPIYEVGVDVNCTTRPKFNGSELICKNDFRMKLGNPGFEITPTGLIRQWGTIQLYPVRDFNSEQIGNTKFYTNYYEILLPIAFPNNSDCVNVTLACATYNHQFPMTGSAVSASLYGSPTKLTIAVTSPVLGHVPTVHYEIIGH